MRAILVLAAKDLRLLGRDRMGLFWVLVFPLVYALIFGTIFSGGSKGGTGKMSAAVSDEDGSETSRAFVERLRRSASLDVRDLAQAEAHDMVRRGRLSACVVIRKGYGDAMGMFGGDKSFLEVAIDPSRRAEAGFLQGILAEASFRQLQDQFADPAKMRAMIGKSIKGVSDDSEMPADQRLLFRGMLGATDTFLAKVDPKLYRQGPQMKALTPEIVEVTSRRGSRPRSGFEIMFPSAILWGVMGCAATFAISIVAERTGGTMLRLRIAPLSRGQILAGKGVACFVTCVSVIMLLLGVGWSIGGVRISSPACVAIAAVCTAIAFVGLMMLLCVIGKTEQSVAGAGWAILMMMALVGGGMVPLIAMPAWMQTISHVSPVSWGIRLLEGGIWRDFTLRDMVQPCALLIGFGTLCFAAGVRVISRSEP
jgi:ABC-2 type transport system permease protein